jgi:hypothetical protein
MLRRVALVRTDVSEELSASFITRRNNTEYAILHYVKPHAAADMGQWKGKEQQMCSVCMYVCVCARARARRNILLDYGHKEPKLYTVYTGTVVKLPIINCPRHSPSIRVSSCTSLVRLIAEPGAMFIIIIIIIIIIVSTCTRY